MLIYIFYTGILMRKVDLKREKKNVNPGYLCKSRVFGTSNTLGYQLFLLQCLYSAQRGEVLYGRGPILAQESTWRLELA